MGGWLASWWAGWMKRAMTQIEPMGVHPDFRGMGLRAHCCSEGLRRFQSHGATERQWKRKVGGRLLCTPISQRASLQPLFAGP